MIQDSASSATLCALLAARDRTLDRLAEQGSEKQLVCYASEQAHSSVEKSLMIAGIDVRYFRRIPTDDAYRMSASALKEAIEADISNGLAPCYVCSTLGTTSTAAMDPVEEIGPFCREHGIWLHVDAALAGTAAICEEFRDIHQGLEWADSYCFNPHVRQKFLGS